MVPPGGSYVAPARTPEQESLLLIVFATLVLLLVVVLLLRGLGIAGIALAGFLPVPLRVGLLRMIVLLMHRNPSIWFCIWFVQRLLLASASASISVSSRPMHRTARAFFTKKGIVSIYFAHARAGTSTN